MTGEIRLAYLRICQLAFLRDPAPEAPGRGEIASRLGSRLLDLYPTESPLVNRELETLLGFLQTPGAIEALLRELKPEKSQPDQIHTVYALRSIKQGWSGDQRNAVVEWFDRGWQMPGAASMHGYITRLWEDVLDLASAGRAGPGRRAGGGAGAETGGADPGAHQRRAST